MGENKPKNGSPVRSPESEAKMGSRAQTHRSMSRSYRVDVSQELGRSFKSQEGPNGLFRPPTEPRPPPQKPPQAMAARSCRSKHYASSRQGLNTTASPIGAS